MTRTTKRILITLVFAAGLSYFAFTLLFFDPFEGSYMEPFEDAPIALEFAVPRNVDWFARKRALGAEFEEDEFPVPDAWNEIATGRNWRKFARTELFEQLAEELDVEARIARLREALAEVPLLDPLDDAFGKDVLAFGRFAGRGPQTDEAALVFLGSRFARFAYEAAGQGWLRGLLGVPFDVAEDDRGIRSFALPGGRTVHASRHLDLFVVATAPGLVGEVLDLIEFGREQSLGNTRLYRNTVAQETAEFAGRRQRQATDEDVKNRLQLAGNLQGVFSRTEADETFLEPRGEVTRWLMARLFNPRLFDAFTLDLEFGDAALELRGMVGFDKERAEAQGTGFYDRKTFELREAMDRVAALVPDDTFFVMAARVDMRKFLPLLVTALGEIDPAARALLDETIEKIRKTRSDFRPADGMEAARQIASFLGQDVVLVMKRDTYFGPPEKPMPLVGIFLQVTDRGPDTGVIDADSSKGSGYNGFLVPIMRANNRLRSETRGVSRWFNVTHRGETPADERSINDIYFSGTEIRNVAFGIIDPAGKKQGPWTLAVTLSPRYRTVEKPGGDGGTAVEEHGTAYEFLIDIIGLNSLDPQYSAKWVPDAFGQQRLVTQLLHSDQYKNGNEFLSGFASVAMFLDAGGLKDVLVDRSRDAAEAMTEIDWEAETAKIEKDLRDGEFAQWQGREMPAEVAKRFERRVYERKEQRDLERRMNEVPAAQKKYEEGLAWVELLQDAFLAARIDETSQVVEIRARVRADLD